MGVNARVAQYGRAIRSHASNVGTSTALRFGVPQGAANALFTAGDEAVRWRVDGSDPTSTVGHYLPANGSVEIFGADLDTFRFIAVANTSACFVTFFGD